MVGYRLSIGEFKAEARPEDRYVKKTVQEPSESVIEASPKSSMVDGQKTNCLATGYSQWFQFIWSVGLLDVFKGATDELGKEDWEFGADAPRGIDYGRVWYHDGEQKAPILRNHPAAVALDEDYLERFEQAREYWRGHPVREWSIEQNENHDDINGRRLRWLCWWTEWALENCEYPTFVNR